MYERCEQIKEPPCISPFFLLASLERLELGSGEFAYLRILVVFASDFPGLPDHDFIASLRRRALRELFERLQMTRYVMGTGMVIQEW